MKGSMQRFRDGIHVCPIGREVAQEMVVAHGTSRVSKVERVM
jgi:hypothetical protein